MISKGFISMDDLLKNINANLLLDALTQITLQKKCDTLLRLILSRRSSI